MSVLTIAGLELRRFLRDRANIFFVFIFPLALVLLIGAQFGEGATRGTAIVTGPDTALRSAVVTALAERDLEVELAGTEAATQQVARSRVDVAVVVDEAAAAAYAERSDLALEVLTSSRITARTTLEDVRVATATLASEQGQVEALVSAGVTPEEAAAALRRAEPLVRGPELRTTGGDEVSEAFAGLGRFDLGASAQLALFVFLTSLTGAATLIQARRLGLVARTLAAPVSPSGLLAGEALGRWVIALVQGVYIVAATALLFDVDWGSLSAALVVLAAFAAVGAGAAMLLGAAVDNEGTASGLGVGLGLVLAALGGSMMPLDFFPDTLQTLAHVTPHAWAYDAFAELQRREGGLVDVLPELAALVGMAAVLLTLGVWALRRSLARTM